MQAVLNIARMCHLSPLQAVKIAPNLKSNFFLQKNQIESSTDIS